jgi:hypothetical protein
MEYYVYAYLREDGTPYYIGKGKGKRAWSKQRNINLPVDKSKIVLIEENVSEVWALLRERYYIRWFGRKDNGTGILRNLTDGGEGTSGYILSEEQKDRYRRGKNSPTYGRKITEEHKQKLREAKLGKKQSPETLKKRSEAMKGKNSGANCVFNRPEIRKLITDLKRGSKQSPETIAKRMAKMKGDDNPSRKYRVNCRYCGTECCLATINRWHNDNCKHKYSINETDKNGTLSHKHQ